MITLLEIAVSLVAALTASSVVGNLNKIAEAVIRLFGAETREVSESGLDSFELRFRRALVSAIASGEIIDAEGVIRLFRLLRARQEMTATAWRRISRLLSGIYVDALNPTEFIEQTIEDQQKLDLAKKVRDIAIATIEHVDKNPTFSNIPREFRYTMEAILTSIADQPNVDRAISERIKTRLIDLSKQIEQQSNELSEAAEELQSEREKSEKERTSSRRLQWAGIFITFVGTFIASIQHIEKAFSYIQGLRLLDKLQ